MIETGGDGTTESVVVVVVVVVVAVVAAAEFVQGEDMYDRAGAVGGRSKSTVTLSTLFDLAVERVTGSVTMIRDGDVIVFAMESTEIDRTAGAGGTGEDGCSRSSPM